MRYQMKRLLTAIRVGHWTRLARPVVGACVLFAFLLGFGHGKNQKLE